MTGYFLAAINGDAQNCAKFINELRNSNWDLSVDQQGYLIIAEREWERLDRLARAHECVLESLGEVQQAA
jgi:hypothetical protein